MDWIEIAKTPGLSETFLEEHYFKWDWLCWNEISRKQILSEVFISKYKEKQNWKLISRNQTLSEPFIETMTDITYIR